MNKQKIMTEITLNSFKNKIKKINKNNNNIASSNLRRLAPLWLKL